MMQEKGEALNPPFRSVLFRMLAAINPTRRNPLRRVVSLCRKGALHMARRENFVPLEKRSKKEQRAYHAKQRGSWNGINPVTRVVPNKKKYNRKRVEHWKDALPADFFGREPALAQ